MVIVVLKIKSKSQIESRACIEFCCDIVQNVSGPLANQRNLIGFRTTKQILLQALLIYVSRQKILHAFAFTKTRLSNKRIKNESKISLLILRDRSKETESKK